MRPDDWLEDLDDPDADVDELVAQITVDAYGDEGYWSFRQAFEDHIDFPVGAALVGVQVAVTEISFDDERRGLTATVQREDHTSTVSLLDLDLVDHHDRLARLTHAYRYWLGLEQ
jgi:Calcium binding